MSSVVWNVGRKPSGCKPNAPYPPPVKWASKLNAYNSRRPLAQTGFYLWWKFLYTTNGILFKPQLSPPFPVWEWQLWFCARATALLLRVVGGTSSPISWRSQALFLSMWALGVMPTQQLPIGSSLGIFIRKFDFQCVWSSYQVLDYRFSQSSKPILSNLQTSAQRTTSRVKKSRKRLS